MSREKNPCLKTLTDKKKCEKQLMHFLGGNYILTGHSLSLLFIQLLYNDALFQFKFIHYVDADLATRRQASG